MKSYQNLNTKDALMLLKAVKEMAEKTYNEKAEMFVKQLQNTDTKEYRSIYGLLSLTTNKAKYSKVYTEEEQEKVDKINAQIKKLQSQIDELGTKVETKAEYKSLVTRLSSNAMEEANDLLKYIIEMLGSKTLENALNKASKTARIK